jgi:curved DNA-binding protein CbpA
VACTLEEVKKVYRKLAMIHHPDKFQNEPESAQIRAKDQFLKIQEAYEYFEANLN